MAIKYVRATGGSDSNNGLSFNFGWATPQWAFSVSNTNRITAGDTLAVCGDSGSNIYNLTASLTFSSLAATTPANPIYIVGYSMLGLPLTNGNFVKFTTSLPLGNGLFYFSTGQFLGYCKFSNILLDGGGSVGTNYGVACYQGYPLTVFDNCRITNCASWGVYINSGWTGIGYSWKFIQCEIDNNGKAGAAGGIYSPGSLYIRGCRIHDNNGLGIQCGEPALFLNNLIYKNSGDGINYVSGGVYNAGGFFKSNVFFGNLGDGLDITTATWPLFIVNNIFRSNGQYGLRTNGMDVDVLNMMLCSNNCSHNNTSGHIDINGGVFPGLGNVTSNPLFVSETSGSENFTLQSTSPCLNVGYNPLA